MEIKTLTMTRKEFKQYKATHDPTDYSYYHYIDHRNRRMYVIYETASQLGGFLFLCKLPIDKPALMWYNSSGPTGRERMWRPDFPIGYPIWKISNTSSDFSYAPGFPVK